MNNAKVAKRLDLPDGSAIVLIDMLGKAGSVPEAERESNVPRVDSAGHQLWRISADPPVYPGSPFTGIMLNEEGKLVAYRWDGVEYAVDLEMGVATPKQLLR